MSDTTTTAPTRGANEAQDRDDGGTEGRGGSSGGGSSRRPGRQGESELITEHGRTSIADSVVEKVAGLAAREVNGVHAMGGAASQALGMIKETFGGSSAPQGVSVEVGERQAAIDLDVVVEYGASIIDVADAVRGNVINRVERITGLEVTEVNIAVDDVHLPDQDDRPAPPEPSRVQ